MANMLAKLYNTEMIIVYLLITSLFNLFLIVSIVIFALQILDIFKVDAPFVPVPRGIMKEIVKNLDLKNDSILYDLGCGNGEVLIEAVREHPQIKAVGVELAFLPYLIAKFKTRKYKNIEI
ncbi:MAG TPA: hypothetical protein VGC58_03180, partial [Candidatus Paceibacterota bacterium]